MCDVVTTPESFGAGQEHMQAKLSVEGLDPPRGPAKYVELDAISCVNLVEDGDDFIGLVNFIILVCKQIHPPAAGMADVVLVHAGPQLVAHAARIRAPILKEILEIVEYDSDGNEIIVESRTLAPGEEVGDDVLDAMDARDREEEEEKKAPRVEQPVARKSGLWGRMGAAADDMMD